MFFLITSACELAKIGNKIIIQARNQVLSSQKIRNQNKIKAKIVLNNFFAF